MPTWQKECFVLYSSVISLGFLNFWSFRARNTKNLAIPDILALKGIFQIEVTAL
jgi:hypothetical protein